MSASFFNGGNPVAQVATQGDVGTLRHGCGIMEESNLLLRK
jgi:hypothetical protein